MKGYVIHVVGATARQRRNKWEAARRWGVKLKDFYTDRDEAERDAKQAHELSGVRFEVLDAEGVPLL